MGLERDAWSQLWLQFEGGTTPSTTHLDPDFISQIGPDDKVLDVGCGYGRGVEIFAQKAASVTGVDINAAEVKLASANRPTNANYAVMSGDHLGFGDESFDKTSLMGVLGGVSLQIRKDILDEAVRVTATGGLVYVSEYPINRASPGSEERYAQGEQTTGEYGAFAVDDQTSRSTLFICKHFVESELTDMLGDAGLINLCVRAPVVTRHSLLDPSKTYKRQVLCAWGQKPR